MYSLTILFNDANNTDNILFELLLIIHIICTYFIIILLFNNISTLLNNFIFCNRKK